MNRIGIFVASGILAAIGLVLSVAMFKECRSDGYTIGTCLVFLERGDYLWIDAIDKTENEQ